MVDAAAAGPPADLPPQLRLAPRVEAYLADVVRMCTAPGYPVLSVVLFGSAATGGYAAAVSDVDLLVVLRDDASADGRRQVQDRIDALELRHGFAKLRSHRRSALEVFAERITANVRTFFVCACSDLLSGSRTCERHWATAFRARWNHWAPAFAGVTTEHRDPDAFDC